MNRRFGVRLAGLVASAALLGVGCTSTREYGGSLSSSSSTTTTLPSDDDLESEPSAGLDAVIDAALAADDICDVLSQSAFAGLNLDSTSLISGPTAIRQAYEGMIDVFDHLIIISAASLTQPLTAMKETTLAILAVLDRYSARPNDASATAEIAALTQSKKYADAQAALTRYGQTNCKFGG